MPDLGLDREVIFRARVRGPVAVSAMAKTPGTREAAANLGTLSRERRAGARP